MKNKFVIMGKNDFISMVSQAPALEKYWGGG